MSGAELRAPGWGPLCAWPAAPTWWRGSSTHHPPSASWSHMWSTICLPPQRGLLISGSSPSPSRCSPIRSQVRIRVSPQTAKMPPWPAGFWDGHRHSSRVEWVQDGPPQTLSPSRPELTGAWGFRGGHWAASRCWLMGQWQGEHWRWVH